MTSLAERFKAARERSGLTLYEVNKRLGHRTTGYSTKIEKGRLTRPSAKMVRALAEIFDVSEAWLAHGEGPMESTKPGTPTDRYPALTAAIAYARLSDEFPDHGLLEEAVRDATGHAHERGEGESSRVALDWLRELYAVAKHLRSVEGQRAELAARETDKSAALVKEKAWPTMPKRKA